MTGLVTGADTSPGQQAQRAAPRRREGAVGVGIIGAGSVSDQYLRTMSGYPELYLAGIADLDVSRARAQAAAWGLPFAGTVSELLGLDDVELVVNLTIPAAHAEVALAVIESGRHVWGEKPLALDRKSARAVLAAAGQAGVAVGSAPDTILGAGIQGSQRLLAAGAIGTPRTVLTLLQEPGPDRWHPRPQFLFDRGAGPLLDIGPYYITALVHLLGPVTSVFAAGNKARETRVTGSGEYAGTRFPVNVDTHVSVLTTFASGVIGTSVYSFDSALTRQKFEIYGDEAVITVPRVTGFGGETRLKPLTAPGDTGWEAVPAPGEDRDRGVGVLEMARAIRAGRQPRASGLLAFHVLDIMLAIEESAASGQPAAVASTADIVPPLPEDWQTSPAGQPAG